MKTVLFKEEDFKENTTGFAYTMRCENAENLKFIIEALQPNGFYEEIMVVTKAKDNIFEIHEQPFEGRIIYTE